MLVEDFPQIDHRLPWHSPRRSEGAPHFIVLPDDPSYVYDGIGRAVHRLRAARADWRLFSMSIPMSTASAYGSHCFTLDPLSLAEEGVSLLRQRFGLYSVRAVDVARIGCVRPLHWVTFHEPDYEDKIGRETLIALRRAVMDPYWAVTGTA